MSKEIEVKVDLQKVILEEIILKGKIIYLIDGKEQHQEFERVIKHEDK